MVKHTQTIRRQQANCLSVFDHFVGLALKRLMKKFKHFLKKVVKKNNLDFIPKLQKSE